MKKKSTIFVTFRGDGNGNGNKVEYSPDGNERVLYIDIGSMPVGEIEKHIQKIKKQNGF